jgi:hypothetical protein
MMLLRSFGIWSLAIGVGLAAGAARAQGGQGNGNGSNSGNSGGSNTPVGPVVHRPDPTGGGSYGAGSAGGYGAGSSGSYGGTQGSGSGQNSGNGTGAGHGGIGPVSPSTLGDLGTSDVPLNQQQLEEQQAKARNTERQKELIAETQKLVALANELQTDVTKSTKDTLSLDVIRKADEIDKLARNVREKMKNAN